jgi:hypothetical protein
LDIPLRPFTRNLLLTFVVTSAISMLVMHLLSDGRRFPFEDEAASAGLIVSISLYNGLALSGLLVLLRYSRGVESLAFRLEGIVVFFIGCAVVRVMLQGDWPELSVLTARVLFETAQAIGVAFAVAFMAHAVYARYLPTTLLRVRDITPILQEGKVGTKDRTRHAKQARWLFDLGHRHYTDTTKLRLRTRDIGFRWTDWADTTMWSLILLLSFSIYIEVYPRVADSFGTVLTSVMTGHLLAVLPLLLLPSLPVDKLGAEIPVEDDFYQLAQGYQHTSFRWVKLSFIPIIVIALLVRGDLVEQDWKALADVMLATGPTLAMVNMVYLICFRDRTVAETHKAIPVREERELKEWGPEPWREVSLMDGVETVDDKAPGD